MAEKKPTKKEIPEPYIVERFDIDEAGKLEQILIDLDRKGYELFWIQEQTHTHDEVVIFRRKR